MPCVPLWPGPGYFTRARWHRLPVRRLAFLQRLHQLGHGLEADLFQAVPELVQAL